MSSDVLMYETITTTSRRSALAKDESRRQTTAAISQNLVYLSNQSESSDEGASDSYVSESESSLSGPVFAPSHNQANSYRTIIIARLPPAVTLATILDSVRGGAIFSAHLLDTRKITGFNTVRVVFIQEFSALWFEEHAQEYPLIFNGITSKVTRVSTPTWPVTFNPAHSRCLLIERLPRYMRASRLRNTIGMWNHPIRITELGRGKFVLEFNSIDKGGYACEILRRTYRGCKLCLLSDPCAYPLETLLPGVPTSRPDARSYFPITGLGPTLLDTSNPEEIEAAYPALLPS